MQTSHGQPNTIPTAHDQHPKKLAPRLEAGNQDLNMDLSEAEPQGPDFCTLQSLGVPCLGELQTVSNSNLSEKVQITIIS